MSQLISTSGDAYIDKRRYVYLLLSQNEKYKGRVYIGFTVDPKRRLKQHNAGVYSGGAFKTNKKGPWEMILAVHGFPHEICALRFEWAWQNPLLSRRLKHLKKKAQCESILKYHLRILDEMLKTGPWKLLPLQVQWFNPRLMAHIDHFSNLHDVSSITENIDAVLKKTSPVKAETFFCYSCKQNIVNLNYLQCPNSSCAKVFHINCLANHFLEENEIIPFKGHCPSCCNEMTWCHLLSMKNFTL